MAFKMRGNPMQRNFGIGVSPAKKAGGFITDIDELTGEKTQKRATYADTRAAEKEGTEVTYTNKEASKRSEEDIRNARKGVNTDGTEANIINQLSKKESRKLAADTESGRLAGRKAWVKENKSDKASKESRKLDRAAQDEIERNADVAEKKKKGDRSNTEFLTRTQMEILSDNKTKTKGKVDLNKADTESGISQSYNKPDYKESKSPGKIAPLVMMGAQMLGKKMMEKKEEKA